MEPIKKIALLNIPNKNRIQRRYMCSYNAPNMLYPPIELMYLASISKEWHNKEVLLIDAIAEKKNSNQVEIKLKKFNPDIVVSLTGFEVFEEDMKTIKEIKAKFKSTKFCLFGHYATIFPEETFRMSQVDFILEGEPDINFSNLINYLDNKIQLQDLTGVFIKKNNTTYHKKGLGRIINFNELPLPAHDLINPKHYFEPFLPQPFTLIQTARGCPFNCNYCVRTFGQKLIQRKPDSIIEELKWLKSIHNIKSFRIIDDTFTATPKWVVEFCNLLIINKLNLKWTCLSRIDTLSDELLKILSEAGCKRIYVGFESGSEKILQIIGKKISLKESYKNVKLAQKYNIEVSGFFMVGHPLETEADFKSSIEFAIKANLDYIMAFQFVCYPGTEAFSFLESKINFRLEPYTNEFIDKRINQIAEKRVKQFYFKFYFRPKYIIIKGYKFLKNPLELIMNILKLIIFQTNGTKNYRKDYL